MPAEGEQGAADRPRGGIEVEQPLPIDCGVGMNAGSIRSEEDPVPDVLESQVREHALQGRQGAAHLRSGRGGSMEAEIAVGHGGVDSGAVPRISSRGPRCTTRRRLRIAASSRPGPHCGRPQPRPASLSPARGRGEAVRHESPLRARRFQPRRCCRPPTPARRRLRHTVDRQGGRTGSRRPSPGETPR